MVSSRLFLVVANHIVTIALLISVGSKEHMGSTKSAVLPMCLPIPVFHYSLIKERLTGWHKSNSQHCQPYMGESLYQPIDDFNGLNFIEIISEDGGDNNLIVSKITREDVDHALHICLLHFFSAG